MIVGFEFKLKRDEAGKRWVRIAPVLRDECPSDLRFFAGVILVSFLIMLMLYAMIVTDVTTTPALIGVTNGELLR